jgi:hypothetical protein
MARDMEILERGEEIRMEGRAGFDTNYNRGQLTLTDRRLIWERSFSIDPFGTHEVIIPLSEISGCDRDGDAVVLNTKRGQVYLFVDYLPFAILTRGRRTREWIKAINRALPHSVEATA